MRDPDWFLKWFFYTMMVVFGLIMWLAASVYASSWDDYLKEKVVGNKTVWYDNSILITSPYRAIDLSLIHI